MSENSFAGEPDSLYGNFDFDPNEAPPLVGGKRYWTRQTLAWMEEYSPETAGNAPANPSFGQQRPRLGSERESASLLEDGKGRRSTAAYHSTRPSVRQSARQRPTAPRSMVEPFKHPHHFTEEERRRMHHYESIDYLEPLSSVYRDHLVERRRERRWLKWVVYGLIGMCVGLWASWLFQCLDGLVSLKINMVHRILNHGTNVGYEYVLVWLAWCVGASLLSTLVCAKVPFAAGSGVPDVMAYLNGVMFPKVFNIRNLIVKTFSCICACTSGLPVGAEGPMIHIGALIGAGVSSGRSRSLKCSAEGLFATFRNSKDQRDFITAGAAAGLTGAFSSPVGGLLFVMEELSTFFQVKFAVLVFFCCMVCVFCLQLSNSYFDGFSLRDRASTNPGGFIPYAAILFDTAVDPYVPMNVISIFPAIVIGLLMGTWATIFTKVNLAIIRFRNKHINHSIARRVMEPVLVALAFGTLSSMLPLLFACRQKPTRFMASTEPAHFELFTGFCSQAGEFNPMATLSMTSSYNVVKVLFSTNSAGVVTLEAGFVYFLLYSSFAAYSSGMFISSGIVIPTILIGALAGRFVGECFNFYWADPGVMALVGAAAFFGGLSRLTFALAVIMLEVSNDLTHIVLFMVGIMIAKMVADKFCHSLYHGQLDIKCLPFLDYDERIHKLDVFTAGHIRNRTKLVVIHETETVEKLSNILRSTDHNAFPVVSRRDNSFLGLILKSQLETLMWYHHLKETNSLPECPGNGPPTYADLKAVQNRMFWERLNAFPVAEAPVPWSAALMLKQLDVAPHYDRSSVVVPETMCVSRTYQIFRSLQLRHLVVLNRSFHVVGIITRKDLIGDVLLERCGVRKVEPPAEGEDGPASPTGLLSSQPGSGSLTAITGTPAKPGSSHQIESSNSIGGR